MPVDRFQQLYDGHFAGLLSEREEAELAALLREPTLQRRWRLWTMLDAKLDEELRVAAKGKNGRRQNAAQPRASAQVLAWPGRIGLAAAASLLAALGLGLWLSRTDPEMPLAHGAVARVESVQGTAFRIQDIAPQRRALKAGDEIREGMRIETSVNSAVKLAWIEEATRVEVAGNSKLETRNSKRAFLYQGRLTAQVAEQPTARPFEVETPHALATVLGTRFRLEVRGETGRPLASAKRLGEAGTSDARLPAVGSAKAGRPAIPFTRLDVEGGQVRFTRLTDQASVDVAAGEFTVAGAKAEDFTLKAYPRDTKWIEGPILFEDDFVDGFKHWKSGKLRVDENGNVAHEPFFSGDGHRFADAHLAVPGKTVTGILLEAGSQSKTMPFIALKEKIAADAYTVEFRYNLWLQDGGSIAGPEFGPVRDFDYIFRSGPKERTFSKKRMQTDPHTWHVSHYSITPLHDGPFMLLLNVDADGEPQMKARINADAGFVGFHVKRGKAMVYRCVVRELIPANRIPSVPD